MPFSLYIVKYKSFSHMQEFLRKKDNKTVFCKVQVAKLKYLVFFLQIIWPYQKKVVPLQSKTKNKFNLQK